MIWATALLLLPLPFIEAKIVAPRHWPSPTLVVSDVSRNKQRVTFSSSNTSWGGSSSVSRSVTECRSILICRGGAQSRHDEDEHDPEEDADDEWDDDDDDDDDDDGFLQNFQEPENSSDFREDNILDRLMDHYSKTPPLSKAYLTASFALTLGGYLMNGNRFPSILTLDWAKVLKRFQIWRPFTTFLNFGSFGFAYFLTLQFVWTYMSDMERIAHNKPYDFWIMVLFGMLSMLVGYSAMRADVRFLGHNLSTFLVYVWSRTHEGAQVSMFSLFNTRAELLPWFFIGQVSVECNICFLCMLHPGCVCACALSSSMILLTFAYNYLRISCSKEKYHGWTSWGSFLAIYTII
jgi:Derlin-2/3